MALRRIITDGSFLDPINHGDAEVAQHIYNLGNLYDSHVHIVDVVLEKRVQADQEIIESDLRSFHVEHMRVYTPFKRAFDEYNNSGRLNKFSPEIRPTIALALYMRVQGFEVELLSANVELRDAFLLYNYGKIVQFLPAQTRYSGTPDYNRARRLLFVKRTLNVAANGKVLPTAPPPPAGPVTKGGFRTTGPTIGTVKRPIDLTASDYTTPREKSGPRLTHTKPRTEATGDIWSGKKPTGEADWKQGRGESDVFVPDRVHPQMAPNDARFQKWDTILRALNFVVQWLNGKIQGKRYEARWKVLEPEIKDHLVKNPTHGALVLVYFSRREKRGSEIETPLQHTDKFNGITVAYGRTEEEALANVRPSDIGHDIVSNLSPGQLIPKGNRYWIPPLQSVYIGPVTSVDYEEHDTTNLFGKWGLGTFVPGLEEVTRVKFSRASAFDDKMKSVERVDIKPLAARFIILVPPREISYVYEGKLKTMSYSTDFAEPGQVDDPHYKQFKMEVVELDSAVNPYDAEAAMVVAADKRTEHEFMKTNATDTGGLIVFNSFFMKRVRWVKPHKIRLLRNIDVDDRWKATAESDARMVREIMR